VVLIWQRRNARIRNKTDVTSLILPLQDPLYDPLKLIDHVRTEAKRGVYIAGNISSESSTIPYLLYTFTHNTAYIILIK
jgi:hypothetical protein